MPKKCGGPLCGKLVSDRQHSSVRLGENLFCSHDCKREWLDEHHIEVHTGTTANDPLANLLRVNGGSHT